MVLGDPEGSQGECRRAQEKIQREKRTKEAWVLFGDGDEYLIYRAIGICVGS
jgi:hypothetical protein